MMTLEAAKVFFDLDRASPIPLYFQIATQLREAITSGEISIGARIENEVDIAERLAVSRPTVRKAIQELTAQGLLVRRRGAGTLVIQGRVQRKAQLSSLYEDLQSAGRKVSTTLLEFSHIPATPQIADELRLPPNNKVLYIKRLRYTDGVLLTVMENYISPTYSDFPGGLLETTGLYQVLRSKGASLSVAQQVIGARGANLEEAKLFELEIGAPVLTMRRVVYSDSGSVVECGFHVYPPNLYSFETTLVDH